MSLPLRSLYYPESIPATNIMDPLLCNELDILSLPLPQHSIAESDEILLTLLATYLTYALTATTWTRFAGASQQDSAGSFTSFANALHNSPTLLQWLPLMRSLSSKYLDSMLTRAYTAFTKSSAVHHPLYPEDAIDIFRIRLYGLLLLLGTSPSALKPRMFWEQAVKFTAAFVKCVTDTQQKQISSPETKNDTTVMVLQSFDQILDYTNARKDKVEWTCGPAFIAFCEYWMDFARRVK
jgi:separase